MEVIPLHIKDAFLVRIKLHKDHRGHLGELFNMRTYPEEIRRLFPVQQVTWSANHKNSIRGIHISPYAKLLTCVQGSVYDVIVDMRPDSPSYLKWAAVNLSAANGMQALIPPDCGHGYLALEEHAAVVYCQGGYFDPAQPQLSSNCFDPILSIAWPLENPEKNVLISPKDKIVEHLSFPDGKIIPHRKRILIIGSTGQVGSNLIEMIEKNHPEFITIGTKNTSNKSERIPFDLETDGLDPCKLNLLLDACSPHVIIIAAAFANVNLCESLTEKANKANCESVTEIAKLGKERNIKVIFISTDMVFNSPNPKDFQDYINLIASDDIGIHEDGEKNPINHYALTKFNAEKALSSVSPTALIIRTSRIYGPEENRKNFVNQIVKNLSNGKEMTLFSDELSCPTYNRDICKAILLLLKKDCSGIYHIVGPESMSKYRWGVKTAEYFKLDTKLLIPKTSEEFQLPAPRGKFTSLSTHKFRTEFPDFRFHTLDEALTAWKECNKNFPVASS